MKSSTKITFIYTNTYCVCILGYHNLWVYHESCCIFCYDVNLCSDKKNCRKYQQDYSQTCIKRFTFGTGAVVCSWIYNYLCNQCLSPLMLWVWIPLRRCVFDTTLCDKVCQWLVTGQWFSLVTPFSSTNKTDRDDIA